MGMGHGSAYADTVADDFVKEICPQEHEAFFSFLKEKGISIEDVANYNDDLNQFVDFESEDDEEQFVRYQTDLTEMFEHRTGLSLWLNYHDSRNDGSRYDDIDGWFWCIGNVYDYTPAGEKYKAQIKRANWVWFG